MHRSALVTALLLPCLAAPPLGALGVDSVVIDGATAHASVSALGGIAAELTIEFESVANLSASSLGLSVQTIDPTSLALVARLPSGASVPTGFPLLVRIEPPAAAGLAFHGSVDVEIHTANLEFVEGTPLRIFAAPSGGGFVDITRQVGSGSYRGRGTKGSFSEFLILADLRAASSVVAAKLDALDALLVTHSPSMPAEWRDELAGYADDARDAVGDDDVSAALDAVDTLLARIDEGAGDELPDLWRAARDVANVAGELAAAARTLRFSLLLLPGAPG